MRPLVRLLAVAAASPSVAAPASAANAGRSRAADEPCGAAAWCAAGGAVECSFQQLPVTQDAAGVTFTVPYYSVSPQAFACCFRILSDRLLC